MKYLMHLLEVVCFSSSIWRGSTCWFSKWFWDIHDYPVNKGGNGSPLVDTTHTCPRCGKVFTFYS
jgi:hypothetical protein